MNRISEEKSIAWFAGIIMRLLPDCLRLVIKFKKCKQLLYHLPAEVTILIHSFGDFRATHHKTKGVTLTLRRIILHLKEIPYNE